MFNANIVKCQSLQHYTVENKVKQIPKRSKLGFQIQT